jgi:tRNA U55 pseudouridine synthase TruB
MVGKRMPDVDCGGTRLYELLRAGKFVMATTEDVEVDRTDVVHAIHRDPSVPAAVLVRPDGYVAWADDRLATPWHAAVAIDHWCRRPGQK